MNERPDDQLMSDAQAKVASQKTYSLRKRARLWSETSSNDDYNHLTKIRRVGSGSSYVGKYVYDRMT